VQKNQTTIKREICLSGIGVHSGQESQLVIRPAAVDYGIVFICPVTNGDRVHLAAHASRTLLGDLCTTLTEGEARIETIEHLMAAISACGIDNLAIETSHHEVPILDGSARIFVQAFMDAGLVRQQASRRYLRITKPLRLEAAPAWAEFLPCDTSTSSGTSSCHFDISIDFASPAIGHQHIGFELAQEFFAREIAPARTFGFLKQAEILRARGLARGASLENCLIIGPDDRLLGGQSLRFEDEFVRHKALDAIGDTALLGVPFIGIFRSYRPSHRLNGEIVKTLLANPSHFEMIS